MERIDDGFKFDTEKVSVDLEDFVGVSDEVLLGGSEKQQDYVELLSFENIVPKEGSFLGLDISKSSTGVCIVEGGEKRTYNISLNMFSETISTKNHQEVLLRRRLKSELLTELEGKHFNAIIIEDAFVGENPKDARLLFALNTAIDELILDGLCSCDEFYRVENSKWKSWLWKNVDASGEFKGLNDKIRIQECLYKLGIVESGEGFQDRLDATGMLVGYFLQKKKGTLETRKSINWGQIELAYELDESFIYDNEEWLIDLKVIRFTQERVTKKFIKESLEGSPLGLFISKTPIKLGFLGEKLGLDYMEDGGYLAFWLKKKYRKKYE